MTDAEAKVKLPIALFKARVCEEVVLLVALQPYGFIFDELASRLGPSFASKGPEERRLRHQLKALCDSDVLYSVDRGVFLEGRHFASISGCGPLEDDIWNAFYELGGTATTEDLKAVLVNPADDRKIRSVLRATDKYFKGLPLAGYRNHWFVNDDLRWQIPLPGALQSVELTILDLRLGSRATKATALQRLKLFQSRIGASLREARMLSRFEPDDVVKGPALANTLDIRLRACIGRPEDSKLAERHRTVGEWWAETVKTNGRPRALYEAWLRIEGSPKAKATLQGALDVHCWDAIGRAVGLDPGALSRGALRSRSPQTP